MNTNMLSVGHLDQKESPVNFMGCRVGNSFCMVLSVPPEISDVLSFLKSGKLLGRNSIPMQVSKLLSLLISGLCLMLYLNHFSLGYCLTR